MRPPTSRINLKRAPPWCAVRAAGERMADEVNKYETRTVKAIRGTEDKTAARWEQQGWEVVASAKGKLTTELTLRRAKSKTPWGKIAVGGGAFATVLVAIVVLGILNERATTATPEDQAEVLTSTPSAVAEGGEGTAGEPSGTPSAVPSPAQATQSALTPENNAEFAAILELGDYCSADIATFAQKYAGSTVEFDASIGSMGPHGNAKTRYDILLTGGDFSETVALGPAFLFRDVNTTYDLHYSGETPDTVGVGDNLRVTAEILSYEERSCLFLLEPVATSFR